MTYVSSIADILAAGGIGVLIVAVLAIVPWGLGARGFWQELAGVGLVAMQVACLAALLGVLLHVVSVLPW